MMDCNLNVAWIGNAALFWVFSLLFFTFFWMNVWFNTCALNMIYAQNKHG
jgi:hypothetical protein